MQITEVSRHTSGRKRRDYFPQWGMVSPATHCTQCSRSLAATSCERNYSCWWFLWSR